jgi:hypothetical protein
MASEQLLRLTFLSSVDNISTAFSLASAFRFMVIWLQPAWGLLMNIAVFDPSLLVCMFSLMHGGPGGGLPQPDLAVATSASAPPAAAAAAPPAAAAAGRKENSGNLPGQVEGAGMTATSNSRTAAKQHETAGGGTAHAGEAHALREPDPAAAAATAPEDDDDGDEVVSSLPQPGAIVEYPLTPREQDEYQDGRLAGAHTLHFIPVLFLCTSPLLVMKDWECCP